MNIVKSCLICLFLLCGAVLKAQIVNIESERIQTDTTGWAGSFGGNFSIAQNVDRVFSAGAFAHIQYKTKKDLYLFLGNYSFLKGAQTSYLDNTFYHLRYNRKLTDVLRLEIFSQLQTNKITKIDTRFLAGIGPRIKLHKTNTFQIYAGVLFMFEYEKEITDPPVYHRDIRNSTYLTFTYKPLPNFSLVSTSFYQPRINNFGDFRLLNQESANLSITHKLAATLDWNYLYDRQPAVGVPKTNYSFATGFKYAF
ncbi:MAG: DUF481 domain-containing protein [Agriterribacter sp.]